MLYIQSRYLSNSLKASSSLASASVCSVTSVMCMNTNLCFFSIFDLVLILRLLLVCLTKQLSSDR